LLLIALIGCKGTKKSSDKRSLSAKNPKKIKPQPYRATALFYQWVKKIIPAD
jgi:hypothetical protein